MVIPSQPLASARRARCTKALGIPAPLVQNSIAAIDSPSAVAAGLPSGPRRRDLDERGGLRLDLDGGVVDAEAGVQDDVERVEDPVGCRVRRDHDAVSYTHLR